MRREVLREQLSGRSISTQSLTGLGTRTATERTMYTSYSRADTGIALSRAGTSDVVVRLAQDPVLDDRGTSRPQRRTGRDVRNDGRWDGGRYLRGSSPGEESPQTSIWPGNHSSSAERAVSEDRTNHDPSVHEERQSVGVELDVSVASRGDGDSI